MAKFFLLSEGGDGIGLALRLQAEGHSVSAYIRDDEAAKRGAGLLKFSTPQAVTSYNGTIVIADCTGSGVFCDALREAGTAVLGGSALADKLEADRKYATDIMQHCGIATPNTEYFEDWELASDFVRSSDARLVFKPEGELSGVVPSYVSYDTEDMLEMLDVYAAKHPKEKPAFALQEFIEGTCVSSEAWFNGKDFVLPFNHTIERKQLMNGDIGPSGGCTGNLVWACSAEDYCPICAATVMKLRQFLALHSYVGPIDINAVVSKDGVFGLEFTPRFGYDATPTLLQALLDEPIGDFLYACAKGIAQRMLVKDGFAAGVRVSVPPWPSEKFHAVEGIPLRGLRNFDRFYPYDVMKDSYGNLCTSGGYGITGVALAHGFSIEEAFGKAERVADRLRLPDKQYRTDLVEICTSDFRKLSRLSEISA